MIELIILAGIALLGGTTGYLVYDKVKEKRDVEKFLKSVNEDYDDTVEVDFDEEAAVFIGVNSDPEEKKAASAIVEPERAAAEDVAILKFESAGGRPFLKDYTEYESLEAWWDSLTQEQQIQAGMLSAVEYAKRHFGIKGDSGLRPRGFTPVK